MLLILLLVQAVLTRDEKILTLEEAEKLRGADLEEYVRTHQMLFKVGVTPAAEEGMKHLMDFKYLDMPDEAPIVKVDSDEEPPDFFDARKQWPNCKSITYIRDQSKCGSCWAVSAAETMGDRLCVQSNGRINVHMSDTDILACCGEFCGHGCNGGYSFKAWTYMIEHGVVTGGRYRERGVCKPYSFHPCGNKTGQPYYGECPSTKYETPKCRTICQQGYNIKYPEDKYYGLTAYRPDKDEKEIRKEIMKNGPVQAAFTTYADFKLYKGGIYRHLAGERSGSHAVKLLGWGSENGTDYWILANSWGVTWGEDGGYFRMVRGENECGLEEKIYAGMMKV
ncbi:unnamed protein product [Cylicocyclus nassatus]|uniref:Peptidase C1A papain C-terminal domain-containing protein n=1 Tax=Cylicocyclus nassatus TaxID=53992 RepID=A0AA36GQ53_CYLNA|nr:unnamed protein product [Cylicocyclus nassatus]